MKNVNVVHGTPGQTFTIKSGAAAQNLPNANIVGTNGNPAITVLITCESQNVRFCLGGVDAVVGTLGHILYVGQSILLSDGYAIRSFSFIDAEVGLTGTLMITPFFEYGKA